MMKFQGSRFEERYNNYWNDVVVAAFNLLENHPTLNSQQFFSSSYPSVESLIEKYCSGIMNLLDNVLRQKDNFADKEYVDNYCDSIKKIALEDLRGFKDKLVTPNNPAMALIVKTLGTLLVPELPIDSSIPAQKDAEEMDRLEDAELAHHLSVVHQYFPGNSI